MSATALVAHAHTSSDQLDVVRNTFRSIGSCHEVSEEWKLDVVTALSGSGPAYFFLLMEQMVREGVMLGLPISIAEQLVFQTALGAATMVKCGSAGPDQLRQLVTSPNGATQAAIEMMRREGFEQSVQRGICSAYERARQLSEPVN